MYRLNDKETKPAKQSLCVAGQNLGLEGGDVCYYFYKSRGQEGRSGDINIEREEQSKNPTSQYSQASKMTSKDSAKTKLSHG